MSISNSKTINDEQSELDEIRKGFEMFDVNRTGKIIPSEIKEAMDSMNIKEKNPFIYEIIQSLCNEKKYKNNKEGLSIDELVNYVNEKVNDNETNLGLKQLFDALKDPDTDCISMHTFIKLAKDFGEDNGMSENELRYLLEKTQLGGDELTFDEFYTIMKGCSSSCSKSNQSLRSSEVSLIKQKETISNNKDDNDLEEMEKNDIQISEQKIEDNININNNLNNDNNEEEIKIKNDDISKGKFIDDIKDENKDEKIDIVNNNDENISLGKDNEIKLNNINDQEKIEKMEIPTNKEEILEKKVEEKIVEDKKVEEKNEEEKKVEEKKIEEKKDEVEKKEEKPFRKYNRFRRYQINNNKESDKQISNNNNDGNNAHNIYNTKKETKSNNVEDNNLKKENNDNNEIKIEHPRRYYRRYKENKNRY